MSRGDFYKDYLSLSYGKLDEAWIEDKTLQLKHNYEGYFPKATDAAMLDIGPGHGGMLALWKRLGYQNYMAVDISLEVVEFCRNAGLGNVSLIESIQDFLREKEETFDFISMIEVIEHIRKDEILEVCGLIRSALKPNGRVIIETPNIGAAEGSLLRHYDFTHEVGFTDHSMAQLMDTAGFKEIEIRGFDAIYRKDLRSRVRKIVRNHLLFPAIRIIRRTNDSDLTQALLPYIYATAVK